MNVKFRRLLPCNPHDSSCNFSKIKPDSFQAVLGKPSITTVRALIGTLARYLQRLHRVTDLTPYPINNLMKTSLKKPLVLGCLGLAIASMLPSCVEAGVRVHGPHASTTVSVGYETAALPVGYRTEVVGGTSYYVHNGVYYRSRGGRYVVVTAPHAAYVHGSHRDVVVTRLPSGYRVVTHHGVRYYQSGGVYYQQRGSGYTVVARPF